MATPKLFNKLKDITSNLEATTIIANEALPRSGGHIYGNLNVVGILNADSPEFSGIPTAPTPSEDNNTPQIATTEFVHNVIESMGGAGDDELVDAGEVSWIVDNLIPQNTEVIIPDNVLYPYGKNAIIVSVDGIVLSKDIHYEEVGVNDGDLSNKIKFLFDVKANSTINIWVSAQVKIHGSLEYIQNAIDITFENVELCRQYTANVDTSLKANINSPTFTGIPAAPTASVGTNTTQIATTEFVTRSNNNIGNAIPTASSSVLGGVKIGSNITNTNGTISITSTDVINALGYTPPSTDYTLPTASSSVLGGVKIGSNITNSSGTISLTKDNVTTALGYTPLSTAGGTLTGNLITKGVFSTVVALTGVEINVSTGSCFTKTISSDVTFNITGCESGKSTVFTLILTNGGAYTITYPDSVKWANDEVPELTASGKDVLTFITIDGGTTWYGAPSIINAL